jgi:hypothetical protein
MNGGALNLHANGRAELTGALVIECEAGFSDTLPQNMQASHSVDGDRVMLRLPQAQRMRFDYDSARATIRSPELGAVWVRTVAQAGVSTGDVALLQAPTASERPTHSSGTLQTLAVARGFRIVPDGAGRPDGDPRANRPLLEVRLLSSTGAGALIIGGHASTVPAASVGDTVRLLAEGTSASIVREPAGGRPDRQPALPEPVLGT